MSAGATAGRAGTKGGGTGHPALLPVDEPSLGAVRARFLRERLSQGRAGRTPLPRLVSTGRTGSGKSTLGNLLVGCDDLLRSTGRHDCTDAAHVLRFPRGLSYVDLPGVAGDDRLENFNRVALGMAQVPQWPLVREMRVFDYEERRCTGERTHPAAGFPADLLRPDLVLYLIAPHQGLGRAEKPYVKDLLRAVGSERVLFVLNLFHGPDGRRTATPQDLTETRANLDRWHREVGLALDSSRLVPMDCRSGAGLAELLSAARDCLGGSTALGEVVTYQHERAPRAYQAEVQRAVVGFAAQVAGRTPASDATATEVPEVAARLLAAYAGRLAGEPAGTTGTAGAAGAAGSGAGRHESWLKAFTRLAAREVATLRQVATEPVVERRSKDVYKKVPRYDWVKETDYDRPIYETRRRKVKVSPGDFDEFLDGVGNWLGGSGFVAERWITEEVLVGYKKKKRQVVVGHERQYVRTDHWDETVGHREVGVAYAPLGPAGVALVLTAWHAALAALAKDGTGNLAAVHREIRRRIDPLGTAPDALAAQAEELLPAKTVRLLEAALRTGETGGAR
ncbi:MULTISPECIES: hypothetical protein [unclassified Streptomyces]|uniref:hypothetical protein n=1 Tax=unclassified Streptomyces TaxID=2593676 RepID=UPI0038015495